MSCGGGIEVFKREDDTCIMHSVDAYTRKKLGSRISWLHVRCKSLPTVSLSIPNITRWLSWLLIAEQKMFGYITENELWVQDPPSPIG